MKSKYNKLLLGKNISIVPDCVEADGHDLRRVPLRDKVVANRSEQNSICHLLKRPGEISLIIMFNPNLTKNKSYYMNLYLIIKLLRHITLIFMLKIHVV